jgi:hypothetical protein
MARRVAVAGIRWCTGVRKIPVVDSAAEETVGDEFADRGTQLHFRRLTSRGRHAFKVSNKMARANPMTDAQATELKRLSDAAFEPEAFKHNLDEVEANRRMAALKAKLRLMDEPPHTL